MQRLIIVLLIVATLAWYGHGKYQSYVRGASASLNKQQRSESAARRGALPSTAFQCDGRTYCSQMTSCAEATYFLKNCPGVKMDGNNDGIPCERQWCK